MLAVICSFIVCIDRTRARQLILVIAWSGVAYALYGMAAYLIDPTHLLWLEKRAYRDVLTSTFVNRNTAAVYFGSCAVLWLLILSQELRRRLPPGQDLLEERPALASFTDAPPHGRVVLNVTCLPGSDVDDCFKSRRGDFAYGTGSRFCGFFLP